MIENNQQDNKVDKEVKMNFDDAISEEKQILDLAVFNVLKGVFGDAFENAVKNHNGSANENIKKIEGALKNTDLKELEHAAHSLKGAAAQFGAFMLSELAEQVEQFAIESEIDKAKKIFSRLKVAREDVEEEMRKNLS